MTGIFEDIASSLVSGLGERLEPATREFYLDWEHSQKYLTLNCAAWLAVATGCFALQVATRNYSWVDRVWSVYPAALAVYAAYFSEFEADDDSSVDPRTAVIAALATLWGARLTYNFARKGGYNPSDEDYRWAALRANPWLSSAVAWELFAFFFIAFYQILLLTLIALPSFACAAASGAKKPLGVYDLALTLAFLALLALETAADEQQWAFQNEKYRRRAEVEKSKSPAAAAKRLLTGDYGRGFLTSGLFSWSRHPNFFAEQMMWWVIYGFALVATDRTWHFTIVGPALLSMLFQGSTTFTEALTLKKYPAYADYQQAVSRLLPIPPEQTSDIMQDEEGMRANRRRTGKSPSKRA